MLQKLLGLFAAVALTSPALAEEAPVFPYGAVYFRKSNPPEQDWARDHKTATQIGMNAFRHWFLWSAIEVAPGKYDWRDPARYCRILSAFSRYTFLRMLSGSPIP